MIIKSKPVPSWLFKYGTSIIGFFIKRRFRKLNFDKIEIKPDHSYLLMCNHFSFMDGLLASYLCNQVIFGKNKMNKFYIMSLKQQMLKNKWLQYCGSFSVEPGKRSITESFTYAAEVLSKPGNLLLFFPQGNLESNHIRTIHFEDGLNEIVPQIKGKCQLIWSSNIIDYFESIKPSLYFNMLDCGTNETFDFDAIKEQVNIHHRKSIEKNFRYTKER